MSDGRWMGEEVIETVQCDQAQNMCQIRVPAPGAALIFFSEEAQQAATGEAIETFATTEVTKTKNTVTIDPSVLATSNGDSGKNRLNNKGGTSEGGPSGAARTVAPGLAALLALLAGVGVLVCARL